MIIFLSLVLAGFLRVIPVFFWVIFPWVGGELIILYKKSETADSPGFSFLYYVHSG